MAHFYASIQGNRGQGTRAGTANSGLSAHIRGWRVGVAVECVYDEQAGKDIITVYRTRGSGNPSKQEIVAVCLED